MTDAQDPVGEDADTRRVTALKRAARDKSKGAVDRAEAGIRSLLKSGSEINFRSVARAGSVSLDFLYNHPDLRRRIETLRSRQQPKASTAANAATNSDSTVIETLTQALRRERSTRREQAHELEQRLAAAHGEILRLQRRLREHGLDDR